MSNTCPLCDAAMVDDTITTIERSGVPLVSRCAECDYWEELAFDDGTIVAVGHEPNRQALLDSSKGET